MESRILNVPYRSQHGVDAVLRHADSGSACIAMLLGALGTYVTVDSLSTLNNDPGKHMACNQVVHVMRNRGLNASIQYGCTLNDIKRLIDNGQPPLALIKYDKILYRWDRPSTGAHYVVVVGYDDENKRVIVNDPDYPLGVAGYQRPYLYKVFMNAWGGFDPATHPNNCLIVPRLAEPIGGSMTPAPSLVRSLMTVTHDAWVIKPCGLALHTAADALAKEIGALVYGQHVVALGSESEVDSMGCVWQLIQTELGVIGAAVVSSGGERYVGDVPPPAPYVIKILDTTAVRDACGLSLRPERDIFLAPIERAQIGEQLIVYSRIIESNGEAWLSVQSSRASFGWVRERVNGTALVEVVDKCMDEHAIQVPKPHPWEPGQALNRAVESGRLLPST